MRNCQTHGGRNIAAAAPTHGRRLGLLPRTRDAVAFEHRRFGPVSIEHLVDVLVSSSWARHRRRLHTAGSGGGADHRMISTTSARPEAMAASSGGQLGAIVEQEIGAHLAPQIRILTLAESAGRRWPGRAARPPRTDSPGSTRQSGCVPTSARSSMPAVRTPRQRRGQGGSQRGSVAVPLAPPLGHHLRIRHVGRPARHFSTARSSASGAARRRPSALPLPLERQLRPVVAGSERVFVHDVMHARAAHRPRRRERQHRHRHDCSAHADRRPARTRARRGPP